MDHQLQSIPLSSVLFSTSIFQAWGVVNWTGCREHSHNSMQIFTGQNIGTVTGNKNERGGVGSMIYFGKVSRTFPCAQILRACQRRSFHHYLVLGMLCDGKTVSTSGSFSASAVFVNEDGSPESPSSGGKMLGPSRREHCAVRNL